MEEGLLSVAPACNSTTTNTLLNNHCAGNLLFCNRTTIAFIALLCCSIACVTVPRQGKGIKVWRLVERQLHVEVH